MIILGMKSMGIMLGIEIAICILFRQFVDLRVLIIFSLVINLIFWGVIYCGESEIKVYSLQSIFSKLILEVSSIDEVIIRDGGMMQAFSTIVFNLKNGRKKTLIILLYSFERKKATLFFSQKGIKVSSFDANNLQ